MGEKGCFRHKEKTLFFRPQMTIVTTSTSCVIRDERGKIGEQTPTWTNLRLGRTYLWVFPLPTISIFLILRLALD